MKNKDDNADEIAGGTYPKRLEQQFERVITPFQHFIRHQVTGSVLLILCTFIALGLANSPLANDYERFVETRTGFIFGEWSVRMTLRDWVNHGFLSLFFFVLGLEIKREILVGELRDRQKSIPVIAAALGGMFLPALIFFAFNANAPTIHGWGIPMATDTAFAVGILALLRARVPPTLATFLTALAIIDDLGAILVIAVFYTDDLHLYFLSLAGLSLFFMMGCNVFGCRRPLVYALGGTIVWLLMLGSGVHATVAGILVAMTVPARPKRGAGWFVRRTRRLVDEFETIEKKTERPVLGEDDQHAVVERVQETAEKASTPLRRWEHALEGPVALLVMPLFALVNAGIPISLNGLERMMTDMLSLGIMVGLLAGKGIGISLMAWLVLRLRMGRLPEGVGMRHIIGIGLLGGMGFTMSIFIAGLGFAHNLDTLVAAKSAILLASLIAGVSGYAWLRFYR